MVDSKVHLDDPRRVRALILCLDGLRFSCAICEASFSRAIATLRTFEALPETGAPTEEVTLVVADLWSVVDSAHRVRQLVERIPIISRRDSYVRYFMDRTAPVEEMRHYVQHLAKEVGKSEDTSTPLWGAISWISSDDPTKYFTLLTGSHHLKCTLPGLVFDRFESRFVRQVELTAGKTSVDLADIVSNVKEMNDKLHHWSNSLRFSTGEIYNYAPSATALFCAKVVQGELPSELVGKNVDT